MEKLKNNNVIIDSLRAQGYRITKARENILLILSDGKHYRVDEIALALKDYQDDVNIATIYNNLKFLISENIVNEFIFNNKGAVYEMNKGLHAHLCCSQCGIVEDVEIPGISNINDLVSEVTGFKIETANLEIFGICQKCQKKEKGE